MLNQTPAADIPPDLDWINHSPNGSARFQGCGLDHWAGQWILLDFWTGSCVNCRHMAAGLDRLVARYGDQLTIIGVHSPKFPAERALPTVEAAVARSGLKYPVVNDPDLRLWRLYGVQAWPTVVLIAPDRDVVAVAIGEAELPGLDNHLQRLLVIGDSPSPSQAPIATTTVSPPTHRTSARAGSSTLRFPNRLLALEEEGMWLVSEAGGSIAVVDGLTESDGRTPIAARFGGFGEPIGMCKLPDGRIAVADAGRHQVLALDLKTGATNPIAGSGRRGERRVPTGSVNAVSADLSSPHDVALWGGNLVIAVAGHHQLLSVPDADPTARIAAVAGSSAEGRKDGAAKRARLAMPTALASDGERLWFIDADSSALRSVGADGRVGTSVGRSITVSGHRDGPAVEALLQHPGGLTIDLEGRILIADVFNGSIRRFNPSSATVETLAVGLAEPTDIVLRDNTLVVVERSHHRIRSVDQQVQRISGGEQTLRFPATKVESDVRLEFVGSGSVEISVSTEPPELLVSAAAVANSDGKHVQILLAEQPGRGHLLIEADRSDCDDVCTVMRSSWTIPVTVAPEGATYVPLIGR